MSDSYRAKSKLTFQRIYCKKSEPNIREPNKRAGYIFQLDRFPSHMDRAMVLLQVKGGFGYFRAGFMAGRLMVDDSQNLQH